MNKPTRGAPSSAPEPLIYALSAFADAGIGKGLAYALMAAGTVPSIRRGSKTMIRSADLQRFLETMPSHRAANQGRAA